MKRSLLVLSTLLTLVLGGTSLLAQEGPATPPTTPVVAAEEPPAARNVRDRVLLTALQFLRRGDGRRARRQADLPGVKAAFQDWSKVLSYEEFVQATRDELTTPTLSKLLQLELMLQQATAEGRADNGQQDAPWSEVVGRDGTPPVFPLTLEAVTRWDPTQCLYRERRWVRPEGTGT